MNFQHIPPSNMDSLSKKPQVTPPRIWKTATAPFPALTVLWVQVRAGACASAGGARGKGANQGGG